VTLRQCCACGWSKEAHCCVFDVLCAYVGLVLALLCNLSQSTQNWSKSNLVKS
jgi:hypothetical protein